MSNIRNIPRYARESFLSHKYSAKTRGIDFLLTPEEWWSIWEASGKYDPVLRCNGYVMGRYGDKGPYATWNVYICTRAQNLADMWKNHPSCRKKRSTPSIVLIDFEEVNAACTTNNHTFNVVIIPTQI